MAVKQSPETAWETAPPETRPVYLQVEVGRFDPGVRQALADAMMAVVRHWDAAPYSASAPGHLSYRFVLDEHAFEVSVSPLPSADGLS